MTVETRLKQLEGKVLALLSGQNWWVVAIARRLYRGLLNQGESPTSAAAQVITNTKKYFPRINTHFLTMKAPEALVNAESRANKYVNETVRTAEEIKGIYEEKLANGKTHAEAIKSMKNYGLYDGMDIEAICREKI